MVERRGSYKLRVREVAIKPPELRRREQSLVNDVARRKRRDVSLGGDRAAGFHQPPLDFFPNQVQELLELAFLVGGLSDQQVPDGGLRLARLWPQRRFVERHLPPAHAVKAPSAHGFFRDKHGAGARQAFRRQEEHAHGDFPLGIEAGV